MAMYGLVLSKEGEQINDKVKALKNEFAFQLLKIAYRHKEFLRDLEELTSTLDEKEQQILISKIEKVNAIIDCAIQVTYQKPQY